MGERGWATKLTLPAFHMPSMCPGLPLFLWSSQPRVTLPLPQDAGAQLKYACSSAVWNSTGQATGQGHLHKHSVLGQAVLHECYASLHTLPKHEGLNPQFVVHPRLRRHSEPEKQVQDWAVFQEKVYLDKWHMKLVLGCSLCFLSWQSWQTGTQDIWPKYNPKQNTHEWRMRIRRSLGSNGESGRRCSEVR